jgi:hypothetical protein
MNKDRSHPDIGGRYAKFALTILVVVYVFDFIDRQILSVLAEEIQADLDNIWRSIKLNTYTTTKMVRANFAYRPPISG